MEQKSKIARRSFLSGLGLAAAAGVAAKISTSVPSTSETITEQPEPEGKGYRLTEHIKKYYRTTVI